jgi:hypothetical protein
MLRRTFLRYGAWNKIILLTAALAVSACGGGSGEAPPPTGTLAVTVSDTEEAAIQGARITVVDGGSGDILTVLTTGPLGQAEVVLPVGQVQLKIAAQGFEPAPASAYGSPLPYAIVGGGTTTAEYRLVALDNAEELGWVAGRTLGIDGAGLANALVIANSGGDNWHSTSSDEEGHYVLFNIPAGSVELTALRAGHNFVTIPDVSVVEGIGSEDHDIASSEAFGAVGGKVQFLSISNTIVDITLLHPETGEVVPGLRTFNDGNWNYVLNGIPDGNFHAIASLETDRIVLDPDHVAKFGVPELSVTAGVASPDPLDFAVTGAVELTSPENFQILPIDALTFSWIKRSSYAEADHYILELIDDKGNVIWGDNEPEPGTPYTLGKNATEATLNAVDEGMGLEVGRFYRVRVYASVNTTAAPFYKLISVSEDLEGVFQVGPAE